MFYMTITCYFSSANLVNVHEKTRSRPSTWMVVAFLPVSGAESMWDHQGGNSSSVRNTELMMECNDCLFEGWNEQTAQTHFERWPDKSEVDTPISWTSRKGTKCWNKKKMFWIKKNSERSWRLPQDINNILAVIQRENVYGWVDKRLMHTLELKLAPAPPPGTAQAGRCARRSPPPPPPWTAQAGRRAHAEQRQRCHQPVTGADFL